MQNDIQEQQKTILEQILFISERLSGRRREDNVALHKGLAKELQQLCLEFRAHLIIPDESYNEFVSAQHELISNVASSGGQSASEYSRTLSKIASIVLHSERPCQSTKFSFILDQSVANILARDLVEAKRCLDHRLYKSCMVMSGSILEASLLGLLRRNCTWSDSAERNRDCLPKKKWPGSVTDNESGWTLERLIDFCSGNGIFDGEKWRGTLHQMIRLPRNLVHPQAELRKVHLVTKEHAATSLETLTAFLAGIRECQLPPLS